MRSALVAAEVTELFLVAHWADLHPGEEVEERRRTRRSHGRRSARGSERGRQIGADGTPLVAEFSVMELGAHLGLGVHAARAYVRDALNVRHRHPVMWARLGRARELGPAPAPAGGAGPADVTGDAVSGANAAAADAAEATTADSTTADSTTAGTSTAGTSTAGTSTAGTSTAGTADSTSTAGTADSTSTAGTGGDAASGADVAAGAGALPRVWQAREVARMCAHAGLGRDQARWVDAVTTPYVGVLPWGRFRALVEAKIIEVDPGAAEARRRAAAMERFVRTGQSSEHGLKTLFVRANAGDVILFVAMADRIAQILYLRGDHAPADVRRSKAVGIMATPARALRLLEEVENTPIWAPPEDLADPGDGATDAASSDAGDSPDPVALGATDPTPACDPGAGADPDDGCADTSGTENTGNDSGSDDLGSDDIGSDDLGGDDTEEPATHRGDDGAGDGPVGAAGASPPGTGSGQPPGDPAPAGWPVGEPPDPEAVGEADLHPRDNDADDPPPPPGRPCPTCRGTGAVTGPVTGVHAIDPQRLLPNATLYLHMTEASLRAALGHPDDPPGQPDDLPGQPDRPDDPPGQAPPAARGWGESGGGPVRGGRPGHHRAGPGVLAAHQRPPGAGARPGRPAAGGRLPGAGPDAGGGAPAEPGLRRAVGHQPVPAQGHGTHQALPAARAGRPGRADRPGQPRADVAVPAPGEDPWPLADPADRARGL